MAGRKLQEAYGQRPQIVLAMPILVGTDGTLRMSKTTGNYVGIDEPPAEMYGKVMSIPDSALLNYYTLVTRYSPQQIANIKQGLSDGSLHPMRAGDTAAAHAEDQFARVFQAGLLPSEMPVHALRYAPINIIDLMVQASLARSKSEARRLVQQGGVRLDGQQIADIEQTISTEGVLQVGKRRFVRLERKS
jgi:tyrosyl-tRNA synthetase